MCRVMLSLIAVLNGDSWVLFENKNENDKDDIISDRSAEIDEKIQDNKHYAIFDTEYASLILDKEHT